MQCGTNIDAIDFRAEKIACKNIMVIWKWYLTLHLILKCYLNLYLMLTWGVQSTKTLYVLIDAFVEKFLNTDIYGIIKLISIS